MLHPILDVSNFNIVLTVISVFSPKPRWGGFLRTNNCRDTDDAKRLFSPSIRVYITPDQATVVPG